jgi:hypothetical protein
LGLGLKDKDKAIGPKCEKGALAFMGVGFQKLKQKRKNAWVLREKMS